MNKLTNEEIFRLFNEVIKTNKNSCFSFDKKTGLVGLDGDFCSDELREIARVLDEVNHGTSTEIYVDL